MTTSPKQIRRPPTDVRLWITCAFGLLTLLLCARYLLGNTMSPDSWLHIGTGRFILEHKYLPHHGDISYKITAPIFEWVPASWLSDVMLYVSSAKLTVGGPLISITILLFTLWLLYIVGGFLTIPNVLRVVSITIAAILTLSFWRLHPLLFLVPLTVLLELVFIRWTQTKIHRLLWILPLITVLWANIGGGFLFIPLGIIIAYIAHYLLTEKYSKKERIGIITPAVTGALVTLINPSGIRVWIYNVTVIGLLDSRKWYSTLTGALEATNTSIIKNAPSTIPFVLALAYLLVTVFALGYVLVSDWRISYPKVRPVLPLAVLLILPFLWIRFIPIGLIPTLPLFIVVLSLLLRRLNGPGTRFAGLFGVSTGLLILLGLLSLPAEPSQSPPVHQLDMIEAFQLPRTVLVSTDLVGYSYYRLYPDKGFIDAQDDMFDDNDTLAIYSQFSTVSDTQAKQLLAAYPNINAVMLSKENDYLTGYFDKQPDWALVYLDYNGLLFVRKSFVSESFLRDHELSALDLTTDLGTDPKHIPDAIIQLEKFTKTYPDSTLAIGQLASLYRVSGRLDQAIGTIKRIPQAKWDFVVKTEMGRILAAKGDCADAERFFLDALGDRNEKNVSKTTLDLAILYAVCLKDNAKAQHYFKRYTSYPIPQTERDRATEIMKRYVINLELDTPP